MPFSVRPGFILFLSDRSGSYVVMYGPDGRGLPFRNDDGLRRASP